MTDFVAERSAHDSEDPSASLSHRQILAILSGLSMGVFLAGLDHTIVSTAIRIIADDLNGFSLLAWATTAYLISATIAMPIYGKLSDIYGRKPLYLTAISIFLIGSLACAFAQSMYTLAVFRFAQGLGAGGLTSLALTIVADITPPRLRAKYQGNLVSILVTSTVLGPVIGGLLVGVERFAGIDGWRWVFLVNLPVAISALFVVARVLNVPSERQHHRIDWWGGATLVIGIVPMLLVAEQGREWGWTSISTLACSITGLVGLGVFIWVEFRMADSALIPLRLLRNMTFNVAIGASFLIGFGMFGAIVLIPQYLQIVRSYTPMQAGLFLAPLMAAAVLGTTAAGRTVAKTGKYKAWPIVGTALVALGSLLFAQIEWNSPVWLTLASMVIIGFGLGGSMQTLVIAAQNTGSCGDIGVSTASAMFFRQVGGTFGVAVLVSILFSTLGGNIRAAFAELGLPPAPVIAGEVDIMRDSSFLKEIPLEQAQPYLMGFNESVSTVFYVAAGLAALTSVVTMFMREIPLVDGSDGQSSVSS